MSSRKLISRILLTGVVCIISIIAILGYCRSYDINNSNNFTIARYVSYRSYPKSESNYFVFYRNNKRLRVNAGRAPEGFPRNLGRFYRIKYSKKYEEVIRPLFDQEVTDTAAILEAGFPIEEVRKRLRNQHK